MRDGGTTGTTTSRFAVRSADGTPLAVWVDGAGPALVLVHGSLVDHTHFASLVAALRNDMTTFSMDRRGFGSSGDASPYDIDREFDDVAAVVDAVAARTGGPVALWGHSYGASCALGAAARTADVHRLVLYEPSLGLVYPPGSIERVEAALAAGDRAAAIELVLIEILELDQATVDVLGSGPDWSLLLASAPTVPRECRAEQSWEYDPGGFDAVSAPTLVLAGSESPPTLAATTKSAAAAIPQARIRVLEGHAHLAHQSDPAMVAAVIRQFCCS